MKIDVILGQLILLTLYLTNILLGIINGAHSDAGHHHIIIILILWYKQKVIKCF
jgi:hypothetical protein